MAPETNRTEDSVYFRSAGQLANDISLPHAYWGPGEEKTVSLYIVRLAYQTVS